MADEGMTEEEKATFLLKVAERGEGLAPGEEDYGRKQWTEILPNYPSVVQKLVELEIKFRREGLPGTRKKWWNIF